MGTANIQISGVKQADGCRQCGSCGCPKNGRFKRTSTDFKDPETAARLEAALRASWPPEKFPVSIEVVGDRGGNMLSLKIHGEGISTQEIMPLDSFDNWNSDYVVAAIVAETGRIINRLKSEGRLPAN